MSTAPRYLPAPAAAIACFAAGALVATFGLWLWLGSPAFSWYETFLRDSNAWVLVFGLGAATFGLLMYATLILRGRLRQPG